MLHFMICLFLATTTYAYQQDLAKLPNGNSYGLTLGHPGGVTRKATSLASSFYSNGQKWNKAFCAADADGDGQTNGFEMGDPCCTWSIGKTPMFTTGLSDPNSAASKAMRQMPACTAIAKAEFEDNIKLPGPGTCTCGRNTKTQVKSCDSDECFKACDFLVGDGNTGKCVTNSAAVRPMLSSNLAIGAISCDKCIAKLADDLPADDAQIICTKVLKCKMTPTASPSPTTTAPQALAAVSPCDMSVWPSFENFAMVTVGVPFTDCSSSDHLLQVSTVSLNPNPPQRGKNVAITISGNLATDVSSATAQLQVTYGTFPVLNQNFQLPGAIAGPVTQTVNIVVPSIAPGGTYTAKGVITTNTQQLACITANFNL